MDFNWKEVLNQIYYGNSILLYLISLSVLVVGIFCVGIAKGIVVGKMKKLSKLTKNTFDDFLVNLVSKLGIPLVYFGILFVSLNILTIPENIFVYVKILWVSIFAFSVAKLVVLSMDYFSKLYLAKEGNEGVEHSFNGILKVVKFFVWVFACCFLLDNLGVKISAVVAGLGIGGVAVALAAQTVLSDLFSYFSFFFDKPFRIGDFVIVDNYLGVVEKIGIKTTRISSLSGEQLVFSNSDLTNSRLRNYKKMQKRRVVFKFGVTYETTTEKLKKIPTIVRDIIENVQGIECDRVHFFSYGDFSLIYEVVYYVLSGDYNVYMDAQEKINFSIKEHLENESIEFAYPTQKLYVDSVSNS